ncbi:MAG: hypothetical protein IRZ03_18875 [Acidobacterium ailaaui]|nr:hypothetical protein [Pseudacidobacterium ailaaui]
MGFYKVLVRREHSDHTQALKVFFDPEEEYSTCPACVARNAIFNDWNDLSWPHRPKGLIKISTNVSMSHDFSERLIDRYRGGCSADYNPEFEDLSLFLYYQLHYMWLVETKTRYTLRVAFYYLDEESREQAVDYKVVWWPIEAPETETLTTGEAVEA